MKKWAENMPNMYKKRFGDDYKGFKAFEDWADYYIDFLCTTSTDEQLTKKGFDQDITAILCAKAILEELSKLPQNKYIDYFIQILKDYNLKNITLKCKSNYGIIYEAISEDYNKLIVKVNFDKKNYHDSCKYYTYFKT